MSSNSNNPAALQGWVKSTDPKSGRVFYANHITRKTQWEPPEGWTEEPAILAPPAAAAEEPLPSNWSVMHDPTTGKPFYVDRERKITTWTRPTVASNTPSSAKPRTAPARAAFVPNTTSTSTSYQQQPEFDYYYTSKPAYQDDFSDALPALDFTVESIPDSARDACASCGEKFRATKRRHHCRLCGDIFCDACSPHRVQLPLPQYGTKPVRLCDDCKTDVDAGNYFSFRRYLTPLLLAQSKDDYTDQVNASLSALHQDLVQQLQNPSDTNSTMLDQIVPVLFPLMDPKSDTGARAAATLAACIAWESVLQKTRLAVMVMETPTAWTLLLDWLERSGSDRKTLYVQEQVARTICQLTEPTVIRQCADSVQPDLSRTMRCLLDHLSSGQNPSLQRWSAAALSHCIRMDQNWTANAINEVAAMIAAGQGPPEGGMGYSSFLPELISSGGILLLASGMASEDGDTRAHALAALGSVLQSTRALDNSMASLFEMSGGLAGSPSENNDAALIRSMLAGGAVTGSSVAQLLLSADNSVATMGCQFVASLVLPLLTNPQAAALPSEYNPVTDNSSLGASREVALEFVTAGQSLPALLGLTDSSRRPWPLRQLASEVIAALAFGCGEMGRVWSQGQYEQGLDKAPTSIANAVVAFQREGVLQKAVELLQSSQSLGMADTPQMRIRECAGIVLGSLTACSAEAILSLHSINISQWTADPNPSALRTDASPKGLGLLECMANCLLFSWQHSDTSNDLLDKLLQVVDAGMVGTLSRVLSSPLDWDSPHAVGGIKARTAACRLLGCLAGIAMEHTLGMQRLMQTIEADARHYAPRGGSKANAPTNLIEACLSCLQNASVLARQAVMGQVQLQAHHQASVVDVVDAALVAVGSLCGSAVPPLSTEGTFISGDLYLKPRQDAYVNRRKDIAKVACDVVVRAGRSTPALLPTMLVGGLGAAAASSSLRLALAICANGTTEEHAKFAQSGVLVPVSDSLQTALSRGDLYQFSAALALVRFCGPHATQGNDAVKQAIRVATNVMNLPANPNATPQEAKRQATLKAECVSALESLSKNSSLWSSISQDALPAVTMSLKNSRDAETQKAALRSVLQIVEVPSHAVAAARAGVAAAVGELIRQKSEDEISMLALEVLHAIAKNKEALRVAQYLEQGIVSGICAAVGASATDTPKKPSDSRADVTFLGLEILLGVLHDIQSTEDIYTSPKAVAFIDAIASEPPFVRSLCATLLVQTSMKMPQHNDESLTLQVPKAYGPPLILVPEVCAGQGNTHLAAAAILGQVCVLASIVQSQRSDALWKVLLNPPGDTDRHASVTLCAHYLKLLSSGDSAAAASMDHLTKPLVCHSLLEALQGLEWDTYQMSTLVAFNVPFILLSHWSDSALQELSYSILQQIMKDPEDVLHLFVQPDCLSQLFDVLAAEETPHLKQFLAGILAQIAEASLLTDAVTTMRSKAISALASAALSEEEVSHDEDEDVTSARLSSVLMQCLVDLCSTNDQIQLSSQESVTLANDLGQKICHMVISRFLEKARLQQYDMDHGDDDILEAPDVQLLVSMAQHKEALSSLRKKGGLNALSLIASEGQPQALGALRQASLADPSVLMEGDTYAALLQLVADKDDLVALTLLAQLCSGSPMGLGAVTKHPKCSAAVDSAVHTVAGLVVNESTAVSDEDDDDKEDDETADEEEDESADTEPVEAEAKSLRSLSKEELELGKASCAFLAAVAPKGLLKESSTILMPALAITVQSKTLQFPSLQLLSAISPYAADSSGLADVLLSILKPKVVAGPVVAAAAQGLVLMYDSLTKEQQSEALSLASRHFGKVVKSSLFQKEDASEAAYQLSMLFVLGRGTCKDVFTAPVTLSMMNLIQFRHDPKTNVSQALHWDAAVANCLLLLSTLPVTTKSIASAPLMLARPGKAPRKAITAKAVLTKLAETPGPLALHAQRVLDKILCS